MTPVAARDIAAEELSETDRVNLRRIADQVARDDSLSDSARHIAAKIVRDLADRQSAAEAEYLSPQQAAAVIGVSRPVVTRLLHEGRIPFYCTPGGHHRIKQADLQAYLANRDKIADALADARAARQTPAQQAATELDMTDEQAQRLGFA